MDEVLSIKLDALSEDVGEIKTDVRAIKDESPVHRIKSLEEWRQTMNKFMAGMAIAVVTSTLGVAGTIVVALVG